LKTLKLAGEGYKTCIMYFPQSL